MNKYKIIAKNTNIKIKLATYVMWKIDATNVKGSNN